jgi:hypothetical protein
MIFYIERVTIDKEKLSILAIVKTKEELSNQEIRYRITETFNSASPKTIDRIKFFDFEDAQRNFSLMDSHYYYTIEEDFEVDVDKARNLSYLFSIVVEGVDGDKTEIISDTIQIVSGFKKVADKRIFNLNYLKTNLPTTNEEENGKYFVPTVTSKCFTTVDKNKDIVGVFYFDKWQLAKSKSKYSKYLSSFSKNIISYFNIDKLSISRQRIELQEDRNSFGLLMPLVYDKEEVEFEVIYTKETQGKLSTIDDKNGKVYEAGQENNGLKIIVFVDKTFKKLTDGNYHYKVNVEMSDEMTFLFEKIKNDLLVGKKLVDKLINDTEIADYYSDYNKKFLEAYLSRWTAVEDKQVRDACVTLYDTTVLLTNKSATTVNEYTKFVNARTANQATLYGISRLFEELLNYVNEELDNRFGKENNIIEYQVYFEPLMCAPGDINNLVSYFDVDENYNSSSSIIKNKKEIEQRVFGTLEQQKSMSFSPNEIKTINSSFKLTEDKLLDKKETSKVSSSVLAANKATNIKKEVKNTDKIKIDTQELKQNKDLSEIGKDLNVSVEFKQPNKDKAIKLTGQTNKSIVETKKAKDVYDEKEITKTLEFLNTFDNKILKTKPKEKELTANEKIKSVDGKIPTQIINTETPQIIKENIVVVEYLESFDIFSGGIKNLKTDNWKELTESLMKNLAGKTILCRVKKYQNNKVNIKESKLNKTLVIQNEYFFLKV